MTPYRSKLLSLGLDALRDDVTWANIEFSCMKSSIKHGRSINLCFLTLYQTHLNDHSLLSPSTVSLRFGTSDIAGLYRVSAKLLLDYRAAMYKINQRDVSVNRVWAIKHGSYSILRKLIGSHDQKTVRQLYKYSLDAFSYYPDLLKNADQISSWQCPTLFITFLSAHDPINYGIRKVSLFGCEVELTELYNLSKDLYHDIECYAKYLENAPMKGRKVQTVKDELTDIQRTVLRAQKKMPESDYKSLLDKGVVALVADDSKILQTIHDSSDITLKDFNTFKRVADVLFPEHSLPKTHFAPYNLAFSDPFKETPRYCDYAPIHDISPRLFEGLEEFLRTEVEQIDQRMHDETSIYHHYTQFKAILVKFRSQLSNEQVTCLRRYGLSGFVRNKSSLQKYIFLLLQQACNDGTLRRRTAYTYRNSLKWILTKNGFSVVDAYPIRITRTAKHLQRLNTDDYYSAEDCRELAFHIEQILGNKNTNSLTTLQLYFARILIKTGWNLTPTLNIEYNDIIQVKTPLNPNGSVGVVLQKARAGYRTDLYTFTNPDISKSTVKSAVADLLYVRDNLTQVVRDACSDGHPVKSCLFIYRQYGEFKRLDRHITTNITTKLRKNGCTLNFAPQKIRKGGMNHLYRQVQKNLADYESSAKHDFKTFESHYFRIDENQARYTINRATKLMEEYFTGKELSENIVIITEPGSNLQHTPAGECASPGGDRETVRYNKEHRKLHKKNNRDNKFCADFLSCIWCKYFRLVADPEHIWKLLSYQHYVLQSMEFSIVDYDDFESQKSYVLILKERLNNILSRIDDRFPEALKQAKKLINDRGMHPDWGFVLPSVNDNKEGV